MTAAPVNIPVDPTRLRTLRHYRALSQVELAAAAGVNRTTISRWERGTYDSCTPRTLRKVASALGVAPHELVAGRPQLHGTTGGVGTVTFSAGAV